MSGEPFCHVGVPTPGSGPDAIIVISGELDIAVRALLRSAVAEALADGSIRRLILDLSGLVFIDAAGLGELIHARARAREHAACLFLVGAAPRVLRLLRIACLSEAFPIYATLEDVQGEYT